MKREKYFCSHHILCLIKEKIVPFQILLIGFSEHARFNILYDASIDYVDTIATVKMFPLENFVR